jgi:hypothetical protein
VLGRASAWGLGLLVQPNCETGPGVGLDRRAVCAWSSQKAGEGSCWQVGLSATVPGGAVQFESDSNSNEFKYNLNYFKLWLIQKGSSKLEEFRVKYGCECLEARNNFLHSNFSRLVMEIELKIQGSQGLFLTWGIK